LSAASGLLGPLLPSGVVAVETRGDRVAELTAEEERALGNAVEKRRLEFVTGRALARQALAAIGIAPVPIPSGPQGEPRWPSGIVGSITHCAGYRACAVGHADSFAALGIDAERDVPLKDGVWETVANGAERRLRARGLDTALFSVKEAVYKALYPLTGLRLDFTDAQVTLDEEAGTFSAQVTQVGEVAGRWTRRDGLVVATLALHSHYLPQA
jgi:4'-phosphopantetheinyl transferase EntD